MKIYMLIGLVIVLVIFSIGIIYEQSQPEKTISVDTTNSLTPTETEKKASIGFIGCSITHNAVDGYIRIGGENFWEWKKTQQNNFGGGHAYRLYEQLTKGSSGKNYWKIFEEQVNLNPDTKIVWWESCTNSENKNLSYGDFILIRDEIKRLAPEAEIYASPMPYFLDTTEGICTDDIATEITNNHVATMIENGAVKEGPVLSNLTAEFTEPNGCHANKRGREIWGKELLEFFNCHSGFTSELYHCHDLDSLEHVH